MAFLSGIIREEVLVSIISQALTYPEATMRVMEIYENDCDTLSGCPLGCSVAGIDAGVEMHERIVR
jgi:hypothetical protein